jgi:hypothetical protein
MIRPRRAALACAVKSSHLSAGVLLTLLGAPALAAPPELLSQLALHPTDPNRIVLAYVQGGQGLLFSKDGGRSFALRCGAAVSASFTKSRVPLLLTANGEALLGTFEGLVRGGADGCGFGDDLGLQGLQVADFAPHPTDPSLTFIVTANASDGRATGLMRRDADGTFTSLAASDTPGAESGVSAPAAAISMNRLGLAALPGGGLRFYASALESDESGDYRPILRYSDDEGATWTNREVPAANAARVLLLGVDPTNPDRVAIALQRDSGNDHVLVSLDAGQTFEERLEIFEIGASAVAPDGRLWVGDAGGEAEYSQPGGLYRLDDFSAPARELGRYPVRCLGYRALDGQLFACKRSEFGSVDPESGAFSPLSSLATVGGFVTCGGEALAPVCKPQLCDNWCGVLHYASAPLCDAYSELNPLCGPAARGYGQVSPSNAPGADELALPGDEPMAPAPMGEPGSAQPPPSTDAGPDPAHAACRIGSGPSSAAWSLTLVSLCPAFALGVRRRRARREAMDEERELGWRRQLRSREQCGSCDPYRPRRH